MDEIQGVGKVERKAYSEYDDRVTRIPTTKKFSVFYSYSGVPSSKSSLEGAIENELSSFIFF